MNLLVRQFATGFRRAEFLHSHSQVGENILSVSEYELGNGTSPDALKEFIWHIN